MKVISKFLLLALALVCFSYVNAKPDEVDETKVSKIGQKERFFIASYLTTTFTALSTFTSAKLYICIQTSAAAACERRRLRRKRKLSISENISSQEPILDGSSLEPEEDSSMSAVPREQEKFLFTVWKTSTSTATVTSFSTNRSITVSVSAMCTHADFADIPKCNG